VQDDRSPRTTPAPGRIDLPGGWYLVRDDEPNSKTAGEWFLSEPDGVWVAHFWDGRQAGEDDARAFAISLAKSGPQGREAW
jgi:hypothetical protein